MMNPETRDTFETEKRVEFKVTLVGYGHSVQAAWEDQENGLIVNWLRNIKDVQRFHKTEIENLFSEKEKVNRLCELNVIEQVVTVCHTTIVQNAWKSKQDLAVHGWIYNIEDGILKDLDICVTNVMDIPDTFRPRPLQSRLNK